MNTLNQGTRMRIKWSKKVFISRNSILFSHRILRHLLSQTPVLKVLSTHFDRFLYVALNGISFLENTSHDTDFDKKKSEVLIFNYII